MATLKRLVSNTSGTLRALLHTYQPTALFAGGNWREQRGMSRTGTSYGPLTDLPDWSYLDGRPAPQVLSKRQLKRQKRKDAIARRVKYLLKEVDVAKLHSIRQQNIENTDEQNGGNS